ncbi:MULTISPECIES: ABC transporter permease [Streptacidiphilus]|uniref:ABC transporter permease n=1 Tax=Streptacidiphilus cavernicola TaxID=3342716 RepID=A0ABV6UND1_9ACTN|nr:ABC transporter permease [Streptacidiphilus jeojiense]
MMTPDKLRIGSREAIRLVAVREITVRIRSKAFLILLGITAAAAVAIPLISHYANLSSGPTRIAVVQQDAALAPTLQATAAQLGQKVTVSTVADHATGVDQVKSGDVAVLAESGPQGIQATVKKTLSTPLNQLFQVVDQQTALNDQITKLGGNPATVGQAVASTKVQVTELQPAKAQNGQRLTIAIGAALLLYMTLMFVGQSVAQGVVEEKSSRVVELLLSTLRPWQLLAGKVFGTGLLGLIQMLVPAVLGVGVGLSTGALNLSLGSSVGTVAWALVWYGVGFALYALVFAALGATVSRQEDVGGLVLPATAPLILAWVVGISVVPSNPESSLVEWLSMVPPCAPVLMPMRIAMGVAPLWQMLLSLVLAIAFSVLLLRFAGRIYRNAVLRSGARIPLREALKAA